MRNKAAVQTDTKKVIATAKETMQEIKETFEPESYSPEFKAEISEDFARIKDLAEKIKTKLSK